jgi:phosphoribosyl isomerase A
MAELEILPAVDVADGQAVQLVQGVDNTGGQFGDPVAASIHWQEAGARWIHLVDLDAAFGRGDNAAVLAEIIATVTVDVELSCGIGDDRTLDAALATAWTSD